jgi:hypothetical protein
MREAEMRGSWFKASQSKKVSETLSQKKKANLLFPTSKKKNKPEAE